MTLDEKRFVLEPPLQKRGKPNSVYRSLRPKLRVALKILEYNDIDSKSVHFSQLVRDLKGQASRISINEALDSLIDQGTVHSEWEQSASGHWVRAYRIAGEQTRKQLRALYRASNDF